MDDEAPVAQENEQRFWDDLDRAVAESCQGSEEAIDDALRGFLALASDGRRDFLCSEYDLARCCYKLLDSNLFVANRGYVRRQMLFCFLQEDDLHILHLAAATLLFDGRANEVVFETMQDEGAFPRLVELIRDSVDDDAGLHRLLVALMYEMSRVQRLGRDDLATVDDAFILHLLQLIEELSDDVDDPYHHPVIRVLLVLNEQYMCFAETSSPVVDRPLPNRILQILSAQGPSYRTFGENLILLLNRETTLSGQLLILKILYLLFTTAATYEYFYTNDLHVLVDVIIRNLLDWDHGEAFGDEAANEEAGLCDRDGQRTLRHTYLRVLCPLLKNTQIAREGNQYKREEVRKLLFLLANRSSSHFAPLDRTVLRLAARCRQITWIRDQTDFEDPANGGGDDQTITEPDTPLDTTPVIVTTTTFTPSSQSKAIKKLLGMSLDDGAVSALSVVDMSAKMTKEKPSVPAPRRARRKGSHNGAATASVSAVVADRNASHHNGAAPPPPPPTPPAPLLTVIDAPDRNDAHSPFADDMGEA